jgi:hypothetical protein
MEDMSCVLQAYYQIIPDIKDLGPILCSYSFIEEELTDKN